MKLLRDPLVHFLAIGAVLVALFRLTAGSGGSAPDEIVVSAGRIASLQAIFSRTWQRPPTADETESLVEDYVRDEVLYREALAMGLDRDDAVVRRRMRQKMEFVADVVGEAEPTDAELAAFVTERPDWFRGEPRYSFAHVYFRDDDGGSDADELRHVIEQLNAGAADPETTGDAFMPGFRFDELARSDVDSIFAGSVADSLADAPLGRWIGPVDSAYGAHLLRLERRTDAASPPFAEIRAAARREWLNERRIAANDAFYERLRSRYVVRVEDGSESDPGKRMAKAGP